MPTIQPTRRSNVGGSSIRQPRQRLTAPHGFQDSHSTNAGLTSRDRTPNGFGHAVYFIAHPGIERFPKALVNSPIIGDTGHSAQGAAIQLAAINATGESRARFSQGVHLRDASTRSSADPIRSSAAQLISLTASFSPHAGATRGQRGELRPRTGFAILTRSTRAGRRTQHSAARPASSSHTAAASATTRVTGPSGHLTVRNPLSCLGRAAATSSSEVSR